MLGLLLSSITALAAPEAVDPNATSDAVAGMHAPSDDEPTDAFATVPEAAEGTDATAPTSAEPPTSDPAVRLVWDAPESCTSAESMQRQLDEAMKIDAPSDPASRPRWVIARVRGDGQRWTLRLWSAPDGLLAERTIEDSSCAKLERATLVVVAMLMPPEQAPPPPPVDEPAPSEPEPLFDEAALDAIIGELEARQPPPPAASGPDMAPPPPPKLRGGLGIEGSYGGGDMPRGAGGAVVTTALVWPHARVELKGGFWRTGDVGYGFAPAARSRFTNLSGSLRGCGVPGFSRVELPICGGLEAGSILAQVDGFPLLHGPSQPWVALNTETGVNVRVIGSVYLTMGLEGWISVLRARHFALRGRIAESGRVGYRVSAGFEFRFGGRRKAQGVRENSTFARL